MSTRIKVGAAWTAMAVSCTACVIGAAGTASAATAASGVKKAASSSAATSASVAPRSIASTESSTNLPYGSVNDMVVDTATGHIFVSGMESNTTVTSIEVLNLAGQIVGTVTGQDGTLGLALSPDGSTLYAANSASKTVTAINASTLAQTASYSTGTAVPYAVAETGGELWFTTSSDSFIHEVDLSSGTVSTTTAAPGGNSMLAVSSAAAAADVLVAGPVGSYGVSVYTVASGAPVETASGDAGACENLDGIAINPDGTTLDVSCGYPYYGFQVELSNPSTVLQTYQTGAYPEAVAVSADGEVLVGTEFEANSVYEFDPANATDVEGFGTPTWGDGAYKVAWGADDSVFYAAASSSTAGTMVLQTYHQLGTVGFSAPTVIRPAESYTVTGSLALLRTPMAGKQVKVTRSLDGGAATTVGTFTTSASGTFTFGDHCSSASEVTYTGTDVSTPAISNSVTFYCIPVVYPIAPPKSHPVTAPAPVRAAALTAARVTR